MRTGWGILCRVTDKAAAFAAFRTAHRSLCTPDIVELVASKEGTDGASAPRARLGWAAVATLVCFAGTSFEAEAKAFPNRQCSTLPVSDTLFQGGNNNVNLTSFLIQPGETVTFTASNPIDNAPPSGAPKWQVNKSGQGGPEDVVATSSTFVAVVVQNTGTYTNTTNSNQNVSFNTMIDTGSPNDPKGANFLLTVTCTPAPPPSGQGTITIIKETQDGFGKFDFNINQILSNAGDSTTSITTSVQNNPASTVSFPKPLGNYVITETLPADWEFTSAKCTGDSNNPTGSNNIGFTLDDGENVVCTFKNKFDGDKGKIKIIKKVTSGSGSFDFTSTGGLGNFTLNAQAGSNDDTGFITAPAGSYTISETVPDGWTLAGISCKQKDGTTAIGSPSGNSGVNFILDDGGNDSEITCTFTNTPKAGELEIKKLSDDGKKYDDPLFGILLDGNIVDTDGLKIGQSTGSQTITTGQHTVSEPTIPDGWELDKISCQEVNTTTELSATFTVVAGKKYICVVTNKKVKTGKIKIKKEAPDGQTYNGPFEVNLDDNLVAAYVNNQNESPADGLEIGQMTELIEVPTGNHTISESNLPMGWKLDEINCTKTGGGGDDDEEKDLRIQSVVDTPQDGGSETIYVKEDEEYLCIVKNMRKGGTIEIIKKSVNGASHAYPFDVRLDDMTVSPKDSDQQGLKINETTGPIFVSTGDHTVSEENLPNGWKLKEITCHKTSGDDDDNKDMELVAASFSSGGPETVNIEDGDSYRCYVKNFATAKLVIKKTSVGGIGTFGFTGPKNGFSIETTSPNTPTSNPDSTFEYLTPGPYTITEVSLPTPDWILQSVTGDGCTRKDDSAYVDLKPGDEVTCTFVNFKKHDDPMDEVTQLFVHRRVDNLLTHGPDRARLLRRLQDSQEQPTGSLKDEPLKFSGNGAVAGNGVLSGRMGLGGGSTSGSGTFGSTSGETGATYMHNGEIYHDGESIGSGDRGSDYYGVSNNSTSSSSLLSQLASQLTTIAGGTSSFKFSTSLSEIRREAQDAEERRQQKLIADAGLNFASEGFANRTTNMRQGLDVWVEGHISKYNEGLGGYDRDGDFRILYVGADYPIAPGVLIGALVQVDDTKEDVDKADLTGEVEGTGWMVGPYIGIKLADNLYFDARAAYGTSSNDIWLKDDAAGYRSGSFDTDRWLATATLTGNEHIGNFRFTPQFGLAYGREWYDDYKNSIDQIVEGRDISIARVNVTLEVGYRFDLVDGTMIEPHISISGIANFSGDDLVIGGQNIDGNENRAKLEGGILIRTPSGWAFRAAGSYDGIGQDDFESYSGSLWVNVPLN